MDKEKLISEILYYTQKQHQHGRRHGSEKGGRQDGSEGRILKYLYLHSDNVSPGDLCKEMGVTTARITAVLNHLEEEGLIIRRIDEHDRRRICVELTASGHKDVQNWNMKRRDELTDLVEEIGEEDAAAWLRVLKVIDRRQQR